MRSETVEQLLESLASPGPGPGALRSGALHAAVGASFVARAGASGAGDLREAALRLADTVDTAPTDPVGTARAAVRVIELAERALGLAETLRPGGRSVGDVAAGAEALRAAVGTARVEVEVHLAGITDPAVREELLLAIDPVDDVVLRAAKVTAVVREQLLR